MTEKNSQPLLQSYQMGPLQLKNRVVLAPMTRNRAGAGNVPTDLATEYYAQRASGGLLITEATQISPQGVGYPATPGIHSPDQIAGWKKVTDAVHAKGGLIFLQLWHVGRISHPVFHDGELPVAPSAIRPAGQAFTFTGLQDYVTPRALETNEIPGIVADFRAATVNAKAAGFDGVELHGANGYLINQFLDDHANHRTDKYGGSIENRARLLFESLDAVVDAWDSDHVGIRLSPSGVFNDMGDSDPRAVYGYVIDKLAAYKLAYLHLMNPMAPIDQHPQMVADVAGVYGPLYKGTRILNSGYTRESGNELIASGTAELISYGKPYLANPDLPERFAQEAELNTPDDATFYGGDAKGYTDYPALELATS